MECPTDYDCVWLAFDERAAVAAMITAGSGPIPASVLSGGLDVTEIETAIFALPRTTNAKMTIIFGGSSSFIDLASRGLFVYDWTDIYKISSLKTGAYELVATPNTPTGIAGLPVELRSAAVSLNRGVVLGVPAICVS